MEDTIDSAHLRSWIGSERITADVVSSDLARKFHATFDQKGETPVPGQPVPPLLHFCLAKVSAPMSSLGEDGHPRADFLPPVPLPRRMWVGGEVVFDGVLRVGDVVRRTAGVSDVEVKNGRSGPLCFVTIQHTLDVDGRTIVRERQDIVYRDLDSGAPTSVAAPAVEMAGTGEHRRQVDASNALLFRYSALTFNSHRIHYDERYTREVEGYPGLVVHGPLQATLLANMSAELAGKTLSRFVFRSRSPLFAGAPMFLHATGEGDRIRLWTARRYGPAAITADAFFD